KLRLVAFDRIAGTGPHVQLLSPVVHAESWNRDRKAKISRACGADEPDRKLFRALVQRGEHEARDLRAGPKESPADTLPFKERIHAPVSGPGGKDLQRQENAK